MSQKNTNRTIKKKKRGGATDHIRNNINRVKEQSRRRRRRVHADKKRKKSEQKNRSNIIDPRKTWSDPPTKLPSIKESGKDPNECDSQSVDTDSKISIDDKIDCTGTDMVSLNKIKEGEGICIDKQCYHKEQFIENVNTGQLKFVPHNRKPFDDKFYRKLGIDPNKLDESTAMDRPSRAPLSLRHTSARSTRPSRHAHWRLSGPPARHVRQSSYSDDIESDDSLEWISEDERIRNILNILKDHYENDGNTPENRYIISMITSDLSSLRRGYSINFRERYGFDHREIPLESLDLERRRIPSRRSRR